MDRTVYDHLGGREVISAVVDGLYTRMLADPKTAPVFADVDLPRLRRHMTVFLSAAFGSEVVYAGRDMTAAHAGLHITDDVFDRAVVHLVGVLQSAAVAPELVMTVMDTVTSLRSQVVQGIPAG